jgi:HAD superfamily hydrolase (TIGR01509 family)
MGGDKLMPMVSDLIEDSPWGQRISKRRREVFLTEYLPDVQPFRDAGRLVAALKDRGFAIVAASSAQKNELRPLLERARAESLLDDQTSSDDADESKPDLDIIEAALKRAKASPEQAIMIGDTPYDIEAARRAGVATIAFRSGGWLDHDLAGRSPSTTARGICWRGSISRHLSAAESDDRKSGGDRLRNLQPAASSRP